VVFAAFGKVTAEKRVAAMLRALAALAHDGIDVHLAHRDTSCIEAPAVVAVRRAYMSRSTIVERALSTAGYRCGRKWAPGLFPRGRRLILNQSMLLTSVQWFGRSPRLGWRDSRAAAGIHAIDLVVALDVARRRRCPE